MTDVMSRFDMEESLNEWATQITNRTTLFFDTRNAMTLRVGSDHGFDAYVVTGLIEANRPFDVWVAYVEASDNVRVTLTQFPEDGSEPLLTVVEWEPVA